MVILALAAYANAGQVVDVASRFAPVGAYGPALVNAYPYTPFPYGGYTVGNPFGAPFIGLNVHWNGAGHGPAPHAHAGHDG